MNLFVPSYRKRGASLIEILVVIVIFVVGILASVQVFPGGLAILRQNRSNTVANALARAEMERMKSNRDHSFNALIAANYPTVLPGVREIELDIQRAPNDINPPAQVTGLDNSGLLSDVDGGLGNWWLFSGANAMRQIIGEGRTIPAARYVDGPLGARFGGVLAVQYGPLFLNIQSASPSNPSNLVPFVVYGNDLVRRFSDFDLSSDFPLRDDYVTWIEDDGEYFTLPQGAYRPGAPVDRNYRVSARVQFSDGTVQDLVRVVTVPAAAMGTPRYNISHDFKVVFSGAGPAVTRVEPDTVQIARLFDEVTTFYTEAQIQGNPGLLDDAVYQYQRLDDQLGIFLFHPQGSQYQERRGRGRLPMRAFVDYNVLDWRILRDDFRVGSSAPYQQKLLVEGLKVSGERGGDNLVYQGLGFPAANGTVTPAQRDLVIFDRETGAVILPNSYTIDKSLGLLQFVDVDNNSANGLSADVVYAGTTTAQRVDDIRGRAVRALYEAKGEYAVQPVKAFNRYRATFSSTLGVGQCYVGGTDPGAPLSLDHRIYFSRSEIGKQVVVSEIVYEDGGGARKKLTEQVFLIRAPGPSDWNRYAYIDIQDKDAGAVRFNYSLGYAVRSVRGASVGVRVFWNPSSFHLTTDSNTNLERMRQWLGQMRRVTTETFLMKGADN